MVIPLRHGTLFLSLAIHPTLRLPRINWDRSFKLIEIILDLVVLSVAITYVDTSDLRS